MQLIQRSSNGDYSKLLQVTIENYLQSKSDLTTVRGAAKAFIVTTQLSAFYDIYVPSIEESPGEPDWVTKLRSSKPKYSLHPPSTKFSELQLTAYMSGAIDYMLESNEPFGDTWERFYQLHIAKVVKRDAVDFLVEMWTAGFTQQKYRFANR